MTRTLRGPRSARLVAAAAVTGALTFGLAAGSAQASFSTGKCLGSPITGAGASFQTTAHTSLWIASTFPAYCASAGVTPTVTYTAGGSGVGIAAMKNRDAVQRYAGTDDPISTDDIAQINKGKDAVGDEGRIHTIPVAIGSAAILVNIPNLVTGANAGQPCSVPGAVMTDAGDPNRSRLRLTQSQVEQAFRGTSTKWSDLVPGITSGGGSAADDAWCQNYPLIRAVRRDTSGTTYIVKDSLAKLNPAVWTPLQSTNEAINTAWPNSANVVTFDFNQDGDTTDAGEANASTLVRPATTGGGALRDFATSVDGSISYLALSDARGGGGAFTRQPGVDDKYWVELGKPGDPSSYTDPAKQPNGFLSTAVTADKGSNCTDAILSGQPTGTDPTFGSWSTATVSNTGQYFMCGLTYELAFDDSKGVYSSTAGYDEPAEEKKARTVKDYLSAIVHNGQAALPTFDYAALPPALLSISTTAVDAIDYGKTPDTGGGGGGGGGGGNTNPPTGGGGGTSVVTPPVVVTPPSNVFTLSSPRSSGGNVLVTLQLPGAGRVTVKATAKVGRKTITVATGSATKGSGGTVKLTLKPTKAAKAALKKAKKLKLSLKITFTPTGGSANTKSASLTLKAAKAKT